MKKFLRLSLFLVLIISCLPPSIAQPVISFQTIASGLTSPVDVVNAGDGSGRLFVVEKPGTIRIWNGTAFLPTPFLSISSMVRSTGSEQGLLSVAFHPNYATNGYFFVWYNNLAGNVTLARFSRRDLNTADSTSGVVLLTIFKPFANHNGAKLNFGRDGYLYFGTGDGGGAGDPLHRAQNGDSLHGKFIRIDVNNPNPPYYSIPPTNPFLNDPAIRDEIVALGLRNPWRWSFDRRTGDLWIADVGQNAREEVNYVPAANILNKNYGWRCFEGTLVFNPDCSGQPNNVFPIFEYQRDNATGGRSITGGYVYRGTEFPSLQGYYITSDYVSNNGWLINRSATGGWNATLQTGWATNISSYGESEDSALYAVSLQSGTLFKVIASGALPVKLLSFAGSIINASHELKWAVAGEEKGTVYSLEKQTTPASPFKEVYSQTASGSPVSNSYRQVLAGNEAAFYRLKTSTPAGQSMYSPIVYLKASGDRNNPKATIIGDQLVISLPAEARSVSVFDAAGKLISRQVNTSRTGTMNINLSQVSRGVIMVKIDLGKASVQLKTIY
ncbi:PQQ-dependent sugar dehydrogenase [Segetibacter sp. 3557_3]|uniref:PQQ-dependent sugar dehydrogenase n=1 Tax=Segetibacter sp. 3557_3 TaxID=2547429 RepID=UPI001405112A|nr:PQQ-dependent sugar dehydrogenase [Segetibacter sp. 3557_3]